MCRVDLASCDAPVRQPQCERHGARAARGQGLAAGAMDLEAQPQRVNHRFQRLLEIAVCRQARGFAVSTLDRR